MRKKFFKKKMSDRYIGKISSVDQNHPPPPPPQKKKTHQNKQTNKNLLNKALFQIYISKFKVYLTIGKDYLIMMVTLLYLTIGVRVHINILKVTSTRKISATTEILMISVRVTICENISKRLKIKFNVQVNVSYTYVYIYVSPCNIAS